MDQLPNLAIRIANYRLVNSGVDPRLSAKDQVNVGDDLLPNGLLLLFDLLMLLLFHSI